PQDIRMLLENAASCASLPCMRAAAPGGPVLPVEAAVFLDGAPKRLGIARRRRESLIAVAKALDALAVSGSAGGFDAAFRAAVRLTPVLKELLLEHLQATLPALVSVHIHWDKQVRYA
ncbi:MAG: hypothetical protein ACOVQL_10815, partial [Limnohabitans sp.]